MKDEKIILISCPPSDKPIGVWGKQKKRDERTNTKRTALRFGKEVDAITTKLCPKNEGKQVKSTTPTDRTKK